jgi:hypothetical protein
MYGIVILHTEDTTTFVAQVGHDNIIKPVEQTTDVQIV